MRLRSCLVIAAALLLLASVAAAQAPLAQPDPAAPPLFCQGSPAQNQSQQLPELAAPAPTFLAGNATTCGACSTSPCAGKPLHQVCKIQGPNVYECIPPLGNRCADNSGWDCSCWHGPLP